MANSRKTDAQEYLDDKNVKTLFECLTAGLVYHRPQNHYGYLHNCLNTVREIGPENIKWNTFVESKEENDFFEDKGGHTSKEVKREDRIKNENAPKKEENSHVLTHQEDNSWDHLTSLAALPALDEDTSRSQKPNTKAQEENHESTGRNNEKADTDKKNDSQWNKRPKFGANKKFSWQRKEDVATLDLNEAMGELESEDKQGRQISEQTLSPNFTDPKVIKVVKGFFEDTPSLPTNTVRIFLSSTFSDFRAERNILPKKAYPEISRYCSDKGLDFQVIDMRWGVTDEMMDDHQVTKVCMREIKACQQVSCGPNFVTLIGNRYGYRPIPPEINEKEFELLIKLTEEKDKSASKLLHEWFRKNENEVPAVYELQPITSKLEYYNDQSNSEMYKKHRDEWNKIFNDIYMALHYASQEALSKGLLNEEAVAKYDISVTEEEIQSGLLTVSTPDKKSLCYRRNLNDLEKHLKKPNTSRFVDTVSSDTNDRVIDMDSQTKLQELCSRKIPQALKENIKRQYGITWQGVNLEDSSEDNLKEYIEKFCQDFVRDMKELVDKNLESVESTLDEDYNKMYFEVVHHIKFAKSKLELFCGRNEVLDRIRSLVTNESDENIPIIIHGASGYGKTSLLAKCASLIHNWFSGDTISVFRFLGTSPSTSNIKDTIISVLTQLYGILDYTMPASSNIEKMGNVRRRFWNFITTIGEYHSDTNFIITLDSVDQLSEAYGAHRMTWLPRTLPPNVNIIISTLSDVYTCLENCKQRIPQTSQYIELTALSSEVGEEIMNTFLKIHNRNINKEQRAMVKAAFDVCSQPLFLKLTLDSTLEWSSYMDMSTIAVPQSVSAAIINLFEDLQGNYGEVFVSHALSYLTCAIGGLTDIEMDDILSLDDDVLNEVYQYHDPPLEGTVRIPTLMWARLGSDIREYLTERQVDGKTVKTWYHRQFMETAKKMYLKPEWQRQVHSNLAELFHQESGIRRTIVLKKRKNKVIQDADRLVTPQQLTASNKRKLNALPYHLFHGQSRDLLKEQCLLCFDFIFKKLQATGIVELFSELEDYAQVQWFQEDKESMIMKSFMEITFAPLKCDSNLFPFTMKEMLSSYAEDYPLIKKMVDDAEKWIKCIDIPQLLPTMPVNLLGLDTPVRFSSIIGVDGIMSFKQDVIATYVKQIFTPATKIHVFDLNYRDIVASISIQKDTVMCISKDDKYLIYQQSDKLKVCELSTGDLVQEISFLDEQYDLAVARTIDYSPEGNYLFVTAKLGRPIHVPKDTNWKLMTGLYIIPLNQTKDVQALKFRTRKPVDKVHFVDNGKKVVLFAREKYYVFLFPDIEVNVYESSDIVKTLYGDTSIYLKEENCIIASQKLKKGCRFVNIDCSTYEAKFSDDVHNEGKLAEEAAPFGIASNKHITVLGTTAKKEGVSNFVWVWEGDNAYEKINLGGKQFKQATALLVLSDWQYSIVGWKNGDVSVVCLKRKKELHNVAGHIQQINKMFLYNIDKSLLTLSGDHMVKLWDVTMLINEAENKQKKKMKRKDKEAGLEEIPLDENEETVTVTAIDEHLITVNDKSWDCLRFWNNKTGCLERELTNKYQEAYRESLSTSGLKDVMKPQRYHGDLAIHDKYLLYIRRQRSHGFFYVVSTESPGMIAHKYFDNSFFYVLASPEIVKQNNAKPFVLLVRDDKVEKLSIPHLDTLGSVEIPSITDQFEDLTSNNARKKLTYFKTCLSTDGKYFIICNPAPYLKKREGSVKYFDLIEVETMTNVGRIDLPHFTSWKVLEDSYYYLIDCGEGDYQLHRPTTLLSMKKTYTYISTLTSGISSNSMLSKDNSIGIELSKGNTLTVWDVIYKQKKTTLAGHKAEISCTNISDDNKLVVSGSFDKTIRLWSIETGLQLCLFYTAGGVQGLMITPSKQYVLTNYYCGSQRKRSAILKLVNVKE